MKKPRGRPKNSTPSPKTERIDARVTPRSRELLEQAAADSGRSLSREIEERLERTLRLDGALGDDAQPEAQFLLWALGLLIDDVERTIGQPWHTDGFSRDRLADALALFVRFFGPDVDGAEPPPTFPTYLPKEAAFRREHVDLLIKEGVSKSIVTSLINHMMGPSGPGGFIFPQNYQARLAGDGLRPLARPSRIVFRSSQGDSHNSTAATAGSLPPGAVRITYWMDQDDPDE